MVKDSNPKFIDDRRLGLGYHSFDSEEVVKDVKKVFPNAKDIIISRDTVKMGFGYGEGKGFGKEALFNELTFNINDGGNVRDRSNHLFISLGGILRCKIRSPEVLQFLKKYSNDNTFNVVYPAGMEVEASEVGLPEPVIAAPTPPAPTPTPTPPGPGGDTGDSGMGQSGGDEKPKPTGSNLDKPEIKNTGLTQQRDNGLVLMGLISAIIIITSIAVI